MIKIYNYFIQFSALDFLITFFDKVLGIQNASVVLTM